LSISKNLAAASWISENTSTLTVKKITVVAKDPDSQATVTYFLKNTTKVHFNSNFREANVRKSLFMGDK